MCWIILSLSFFYFLLITNFLLTNVPHCSGINRKLSLHSITRYLWMRLEKFACCGECCGCFTGKISSFLPAFFPFASLNSVHVLRGCFFDCMGESQASVHVCVSVPRICVYENARSIFYFSGSALTQNVHKSLGAAAELYSCFHYTYTHETSQRRTIRRLYMYIWNMDECYCARVSIARRGAERDVCAVWIARPSTWRVCGRQTGRKLLYPEMQFLHTNTEEMCDSHKCSIVLRICMLVSVQSITRQHTSNRDAPVYTYDKASKRACCSLSYSGWGGWRAHTFTDVSLFISHTYGFCYGPQQMSHVFVYAGPAILVGRDGVFHRDSGLLLIPRAARQPHNHQHLVQCSLSMLRWKPFVFIWSRWRRHTWFYLFTQKANTSGCIGVFVVCVCFGLNLAKAEKHRRIPKLI